VLGSEPNNYRVHYYLGTVYTELGENDKAAEEFKAIPEDNEHYDEARLQLAYLSDKNNDYDAAIAYLKQALAKKPNDPEIMGYLVGVYQEKKDYPNAIELAKRMVALEPRNDKYHFTLGALYDEDKQKQLSVSEMHTAIEINPSNAPALNYLGYSYAEEGTNLPEAEKLIKRALVIEPQDGFYVDSLGWVYYQKGEYQKAVDELERAVNLTNSDPTITEHLGDAYSKVGKVRDARHQYEDALKRTQDADQIQRLKVKIAAPVANEQHAQH
jgi:tetratricopeptide (TPR) repeat protein